MTDITCSSLETISTQALEQMKEWVKSAEAFTVEQVPLLVREMIEFGTVMYASGVALGVFFLLTCAGLMFAAYRLDKKYKMAAGCIIFGAMVGIAGFIVTAFNLVDLYKVIFAPRLYILQELGKVIG